MPVSPGQTLTHYRLVEKIGEGGMGEVWRAQDTRLGRDVAVKILPDRFARDRTARARFEREARAAAALSHPNVVALHDVGQAEDVSYAVTELLHGSTLRSRLAGGALDPKVAAQYALQIAQGLVAAHARGLVHRDLKPENVFVTEDERVKILDFGLARFDSESADMLATTVASATLMSGLSGTPGYMSPEQARGETVDHRSDVFSLGAVLYEMIAGRRAFPGSSMVDVLSAVLTADPLLPDGSALSDAARKCLAKNPRDRFQSAADVAHALQAAIAGAPEDAKGPSIAVLPFVDMSQGRDQDYFCEGMAEEILTALSDIDGLRVAARTSTFQFKGSSEDVRRIGQALGVSHVLEGSVRAAGTRLRVTAQLIAVQNGYRVWSERYDRESADVFAIQDEIARAVAQALAMQLGSPSRKHTGDLEAYHLYLRGRHERYTTRNFAGALRYYEQASERDPRYALARVGIAEASMLLGNNAVVRPRVAYARVETELEYARSLAGESAEVLSVECFVRAYEWDWHRAEEAGRRAVAMDPDYIFARTWLSLVLSPRGRFDEAVAMARTAIDLDPLSPFGWVMTGWALTAGRRYEEAATHLSRALEINPRHGLPLWISGVGQVALGRPEEAVPLFERARDQKEPGRSYLLGMQAWAEAVAGQRDAARHHLAELADWATYSYVPGYPLAWTWAALGDTETALREYERSVDEHDAYLGFPLFPGFDPFRHEPRFHAGLRRMGMDWAIGA